MNQVPRIQVRPKKRDKVSKERAKILEDMMNWIGDKMICEEMKRRILFGESRPVHCYWDVEK